jgi:hypothetical protein
MARTESTGELTAPLGASQEGRLIFSRGASHLAVRTDGSMRDLYRARFEGKVPELCVEDGTLTVRYRPSLHRTRGEITLSERVPWSIKAAMGMSDVVADLKDVELTDVEVSGGVSNVEITLPSPQGTVRIQIGGGASNVELIRPSGVPVRVRVGGGASKLAVDDFRGDGKIDWQSPGYEAAEGRYDIQVGAGASRITVRS